MTSCVLLILSTDSYSDLWPLCATLHRRFWPDCPWPRLLASDTLPQPLDYFDSIGGSSSNLSWSDLLHDILGQIETDTVLLMLDDFFLTGVVDTARIEELKSAMERLDAAYLRLLPHRRFMKPILGEDQLGEHMLGLPYRASLQAAFWRRTVLLDLLVPGENPWQFELYGSLRSERRSEPFLATYDRPIPYIDVLQRGAWLPRGLRLCQREGLTIDLTVRPSLSSAGRFHTFKTNLAAWAINLLPIRVRRMARAIKNREYIGLSDFSKAKTNSDKTME